jgi:hypothetical protein
MTNKTIATTKTTTQKAYKMSNTNPNKHLLLIIYTDRKTNRQLVKVFNRSATKTVLQHGSHINLRMGTVKNKKL